MKPLILIILDGWGILHRRKGNAILQARKPNFDRLWNEYPHTSLRASGTAVGLPYGQIGNSEVGHIHLGAGRLIEQDLLSINNFIKNGSFFKNKVLVNAINHVKKTGTSLHLMGLVSDGGVHSHITHLLALLTLAKKYKLENVYVHCFLDGRDVLPVSALKYIRKLQGFMRKNKIGKIASVIGRYYSMDRDNRWNRERKAYDAMVNGIGFKYSSAVKAIKEAYKRGETDEFVKPSVINGNHVDKGDTIIFFNFRSDRAREITRAFIQEGFNKFKRKRIANLNFVSLTEYDKKLKIKVAFPPTNARNILAEVLSRKKIKQLRIAETEKYAHVTFFFNSGREHPFEQEHRILIPSPKVSTYDLTPAMSAPKIAKAVVEQIKLRKFQVIILNFANPDMVGHTGKLKPTIKAIEAVDRVLGKVVQAIQKQEGVAIITADHGNAEEMIGKHKTSHTTNKVPFIITRDCRLRNGGSLIDVAPTMLKILNIEKPKEMKGRSLVI